MFHKDGLGNNLRTANNRGSKTGPAFCYLWPLLPGNLDLTTKLDIEINNQRIVYLKNYGMDLKEAYRILKIRFLSPRSEVLKAHQNLLKQHDTSQNDSQIAENIKLINKAFELIAMNFESQSDKELTEQIEQENTPIEIKFDLQMEDCANNYDKTFQLPLNLIEPDGSVMRLDKKLEISMQPNFNEIGEFLNSETNDTSNQFKHTELENIDQNSKPKIDESGVPNELLLKPPDLVQSNQIPNISGSITNSVVIVNSSTTSRNVDLKTISRFTGKQSKYQKKKTKSLKVHNKKGKVEILFEILFGKISHHFSLTLEDIYCGCTKKIKITVPDPNDKDKNIDQILCFEIKPSVENDIKIDTTQEEQEQDESSTDGIILTSSDGDGKLLVLNSDKMSRKNSTISLNKYANIDEDEKHSSEFLKDIFDFNQISNQKEEIKEKMKRNEMRNEESKENEEIFNKTQLGEISIIDQVAGVSKNAKIQRKLSLQPNEEEIWISLEETLAICKKTVNFKRNVFDEKGNFIDKEKLQIIVNIKAGSVEGTQITVPNIGNRQVGQIIAADIIFTVRQYPHLMFTRNELDIIFTAAVTMKEIASQYQLHIPTLDNDFIQVKLHKDIDSKYITRIAKRGLPKFNDSNNRGDFVIHYKVVNENEKDPSIERSLPISLEEILYGTVKNVKFDSKVFDSFGNYKTLSKECSFNVKPGARPGEKIIFHRGCDENPGKISGDIIYVVNYLPHPVFKINGLDIEHTVTVTQRQLNRNDSLSIPTLENGKEIKLVLSEFLKQSDTKQFKGYGLPDCNNTKLRGDLIVCFNVINVPKDPDILRYINLTLENILYGCTKNIKINRKFYDKIGLETFEDKIIEIYIKPGTDEGREFRFQNLGDGYIGRVPADIVFVVKIQKHSYFNRNDSDIVYCAKITQKESTDGVNIKIPTLEGKEILLRVDNNIDTSKPKIYEGQGLPKRDGIRGNLLVIFDIVVNSRLKTQAEDNTDKQDIQYIDYPLQLEHILTGYSEKVTVNYKVVKNNVTNYVPKKVILKVEPGTPNGTHIHPFDENNKICEDIEFIATEIPHKLFKRCGVDIEYTMKISTDKALHGGRFEVPTLDSSKQYFKTATTRITSQTIKVLEGKGLPHKENPKSRGNLIIKFEINDYNQTFVQKVFEKFRIF